MLQVQISEGPAKNKYFLSPLDPDTLSPSSAAYMCHQPERCKMQDISDVC